MLRRSLSLFAGLFLLAAMTYGHSEIKGKVVDEKTGIPLPGATVMIEGTHFGTTTDAVGSFILKSDTIIHTLVVSFMGYKRKEVTITHPTAFLVIELEPVSLEIGQVNVTHLRNNPLVPLAKIDVDLRPINNSQDVLRIIPGLFIAQHAGGGKAEQIFLRGFDMDHGTDISIHVDGLPVNMVSHAHGQGYADLHFLIPETISNVDFDKGPYDLAHGNLATGGYVDFHTLNHLDKNRIQLGLGQYNTTRLVAMTNLLGEYGKSHNQSAYLASEIFLTNGPFENQQHFKRYNLFGKYSNYLDPNHILTLELSYFRSNWDASGQVPERAVKEGLINRFGAIDNTEGGMTGRSNVIISLNSHLSNGGHLKNLFYLTNYDFTLYSDFTFYLKDPVNGDEIRQKEKRQILGYTTEYKKDHSLGSFEGTLRLGGGYRYDAVKNQELSHVKKRFTTLDTLTFGDVNEINAGIYIREDLRKGRFMLNFGSRIDWFLFEYVDKLQPDYNRQAVHKMIPSPKASITYNISGHWQVYVRAGIGFHTNDTRDVIIQSGKHIIPKAIGTDLGTIWKPWNNLVIQSALWYLKMDQEFVFSGDEGTVEPTGRTRRLGVDLSMRYQLKNWLYADLDLNYANPIYPDSPIGDNYVPLAPRLTSVGGIKVQTKSGLGGSLRYRYMANRPANEDNTVTAYGYNVFDASIHYLKTKYELTLLIENLFNTAWNEAEFDTESRLPGETEPVSELHFTPGTPFFFKARVAWFF